MSPAAALLSARELARAARRARGQGRDNVVCAHFPARRLLRRRWQSMRGWMREQGLRWLVALLLLPVAFATGMALTLALALASLGDLATAWLYSLLPLGGIVLGLPIAWLFTPLLLGAHERETRPPPGSRPRLIAESIRN
jgi:hypothetical protein